MASLALMWEARAAEGRGAELLDWVRARPAGDGPPPLRRESFSAPGDRVLVITWWPGGYDTAAPELPDPPQDLVRRPVHRWRFESVEVA